MKMHPKVVRWSAVAGLSLVLVLAGWWAGRATLSPSAPEDDGASLTVLATVEEATVGRSLPLSVTVEQPFVAVAVNGLAGTVTSVDVPVPTKVGDSLYTVDAIPVRAVEGDLPFYRDLASGTAGADVAQLQDALTTMGYFHSSINGNYGYATVQAVRQWQRELKIRQTGTVRLGEVVAVPRLPAALRLGEQIVKGARVGGGEQAVFSTTGEVNFVLVVSQAQAVLIPPDAAITVTHEKATWKALITGSETGNENTVRFALASPSGGLVCGDECGSLPAQERLSLRATVTVVSEVTGPAVPLAAVHTNPDGSAFVIMQDGERRSVTVKGSSGGVAVIDGVRTGEQVRVFNDVETDAG